jgi:hypothetical protein
MFEKVRLAGDGVTTAGTTVEPPDPEYPRYTALLTPFTVSTTAPSVPGKAEGARVSGRFKLTTPKPAPITVIWEIVTLLTSAFVSISFSVTVLPIATVPKE